jgi:4'-phosphopantetheinyl transferase
MESEGRWQRPPAEVVLSSGDVHVWTADLDQPVHYRRWLARTLSVDERARANRFHFESDRRRFVAGRGLLRVILSRYLATKPDRLAFCYGPHGKPEVAASQGEDDTTIRFNYSHSRGLALYAVARGRRIGVDLEILRPIPEADQIAAHFFSPRENAALRALPASQQCEAFFNCWTRKEALVKAVGDGLTRSVEQIDVTLVPGEPAMLNSVDGIDSNPHEAARWRLQALFPARGFVAALAVEGYDWQLSRWQFTAAASPTRSIVETVAE